MKVLTGKQMQEVDSKAIGNLNIDGLILMENAGLKVYDRIKNLIATWNKEQFSDFVNVVVIAGKGNNGGDGFVLARHLFLNDIPVKVFAVEEIKKYKGDAKKNALALENFVDINLIVDDTMEDFRDIVLDSSIVVDALIGTGFKGSVEGVYAKVIDIINESEGIIVSVDIPSGLCSDTGKVGNIAVEADYTETFSVPKLGLLSYPAAEYVGELNVVDIGIPEILIETTETNLYLTDSDYVYDILPWRPENSNKGTFGKVLNIASSGLMPGAGVIASWAALKSGAGISTLAVPSSVLPVSSSYIPELTYLSLEETSSRTFSNKATKILETQLDSYQAVILGPGLSVNDDTKQFVVEVLKLLLDKNIPAVIDADALNCISELSGVVLSDKFVLTPHPKELSRLLQKDVNDILVDRVKYAQQAVDKYKCNVVLKGSKSIIASSKDVYINPTGNSGLATAGTGDVLSGIIAGFMAQGVNVFDCAVCAAHVHGLSADLAVKDKTKYSLMASDVIEYLPIAFKTLSTL